MTLQMNLLNKLLLDKETIELWMLNEAYKPVIDWMGKTEIKKAKEKIEKMDCKYYSEKKELYLYFINKLLEIDKKQ